MNLVGRNKLKMILYAGLMFAVLLLFKNSVQTETQTGNIDINMNVPSSGGGTGSSTEAPEILSVSSSVKCCSAQIFWEVNFKYIGPGNTTTLVYGKDLSYSSSTAVTVSNTLFSVKIEDLEIDTLYYFKIIATNDALQTAIFTGEFRTAKAMVLDNLTILAKPEKRVVKAEGNYGVGQATIFLLDQTASTILAEFNTILDDSGSTTISNVTAPEGASLVAILKTDSHLSKRLNGIDTTKGNLVLDFTESNTFELLAGDVAGDLRGDILNNAFIEYLQSSKQDEFIDILDISFIVSKFNNQQVNEKTNLNRDNIVDSQDISIVLNNWNKIGNMVEK